MHFRHKFQRIEFHGSYAGHEFLSSLKFRVSGVRFDVQDALVPRRPWMAESGPPLATISHQCISSPPLTFSASPVI